VYVANALPLYGIKVSIVRDTAIRALYRGHIAGAVRLYGDARYRVTIVARVRALYAAALSLYYHALYI